MKMSQCFSETIFLNTCYISVHPRHKGVIFIQLSFPSSSSGTLYLEAHRGLAGRRGPSLLFLPFQQESHVKNQHWHSVLKPGLLYFPNALQNNEPLACLSSLKLFPEQRDSRALQGDHISSHPPWAGWVAWGSEPGWHNSSGCCLHLGDHSREPPVFSSWESFLPETHYFFFTKINILILFSLSLHLPEINNYFFPSGAPTSFKCLLESFTLT